MEHDVEVQGSCDERFGRLAELLEGSLRAGDDLGASVAVMVDGETLVDLWGGWADEARTQAWQEHTITNVWSSTKTVVGLAALVLASSGDLDLDERVAHYWPEFAAEGKGEVRVRHLLSHTSGVSGWEQPVTIDDVYDWERSTAMLAAQAPWWEPGTASGYHMLNFGHLTGEVIRRITGLRLGEYLAAHVAGPLGADFHIGLPEADDARVSPVVPPPVPALGGGADGTDRTSARYKTVTGPGMLASTANTTPWRRADIGGANGHGNARSVAQLQSLLACAGDTIGGVRLDPAIAARVFDVQADGTDLVVGVPFRIGIGYGLNNATTAHLPDGRICWWGGWGGSSVIVDLDRRMSFAYMMNRMGASDGTDRRAARLVMAAHDALGVVR